MSVCRSFLTSEVSAPARRRNAAASNVRSPVRTVKSFVSSMMPESIASASTRRMSGCSTSSSSSSVINSQADDAYGSWKLMVALVI